MSRSKTIFCLVVIFLVTVVLSFYYEYSYRVFVRYCYKFFQGDKIVFFGKDFHLFPSSFFLLSSGFFGSLFAYLLYKRKNHRILFFFFSLLIFFASTITSAYFDSTFKIIECTACADGIRNLHFNTINYDAYYTGSLVSSILFLLFTNLRGLKRKTPAPGTKEISS